MVGLDTPYASEAMMLTKSDHTQFSNAIESGDSETVASMIQQHPELVSHPDWTPPPLHCAVLWNQPAIAELLLSNGADIEMLDPDRQTTPLRYAVMFAKPDLIPVLLAHGANSAAIVEGGRTALQLAHDAAGGEFEEFDDLPRKTDYATIIQAFAQCGIDE